MRTRLAILRALSLSGFVVLTAGNISAQQPTAPAQAADSAKAAEADSLTAAKTADSLKDEDSKRIARILEIREKIEEQSKTFKFGLSLGWRHIMNASISGNREATIDPTTLNVVVDDPDQGDFVLSGLVAAYPFRTGTAAPWGFVANVNIASFSVDNIATFNKSLEGGFGFAYRLSQDFSLAVTIERMFSRSLRDFVAVGKPLEVDGEKIKVLARDDNRFFKDDNLTALSGKFVYFIK